ncbi:MAG: hypothetical protein ACU0AU_10495 [Cognatishimia activa]
MAKQRFIKSIVKASKSEAVVLPWAKKRIGETVLVKPAAKAA